VGERNARLHHWWNTARSYQVHRKVMQYMLYTEMPGCTTSGTLLGVPGYIEM
jgi:hypothetical protein